MLSATVAVCHGVRIGPAPDPVKYEWPRHRHRLLCEPPQPEGEDEAQADADADAEAVETAAVELDKRDEFVHRRRQLVQATKSNKAESSQEGAEAAWLDVWLNRFACWWIGVPPLMQQQLGSCLGALGLHLANRFDSSWRAAGGTPMAGARFGGALRREQGCEWVAERATALDLPLFPDLGSLIFTLPALPRLLPHLVPDWQQLQSLEGGGEIVANTFGEVRWQHLESLSEQISKVDTSLDVRLGAIATGIGGGTTTALVTLVVAYCVFRSRRPGRLALQRPRQLGPARES